MHFQVKMAQNGRKNIFRDGETTKNVHLRYLRFGSKRKVSIVIPNEKDTIKGKYYLFSGYERRKQVCIVYFDWLMHFKVIMPEETTRNIFRDKGTINKMSLMF